MRSEVVVRRRLGILKGDCAIAEYQAEKAKAEGRSKDEKNWLEIVKAYENQIRALRFVLGEVEDIFEKD